MLSSSYIKQATTPSPKNGCYGFLFWTNQGDTYASAHQAISSTVPGSLRLREISSPWPDRPSRKTTLSRLLNITVSWMTIFTDAGPWR